jgi:serine/threonine protein kinase
MSADPKRVRDLFLAAAELPAGDRDGYLSANAGGDAELRAAVERLLAAHEQPAPVLLRPAPGVPTADYAPMAETVGTRIGPYKLMEQIGEGGFGLVFVAEQTEPVRRKVTLKVIKPGMDSSQVIARFEAERQALAMMDHPNIARVLDAGTTAPPSPLGGEGSPLAMTTSVSHWPRRESSRRRYRSPARRWPSGRSWPTLTPPSPSSRATWHGATTSSASFIMMRGSPRKR